MITFTQWVLIIVGVLISPFYGAWIFGGWIADKQAQRRRT